MREIVDLPGNTAGGPGEPAAAPFIVARELSKMHRLYDRPQDRLNHALLWRFGKSYGREFWALRDVSFEVRPGEAIGIVGRNGSGKSTLLEIIAGVLQPTCGEVEVVGRVGALLELGSGFNPEFTGRENVFFTGAILGMSRAEVQRHFEEIAAFADIGQFMDQPVKFYSSGMFVRLAFAVNSVLPKDVLVIDEALAVGDEAFQRKCFAYLEAFREAGGVVLFVSHSVQQVVRFASRAILLEEGRVVLQGDPKEVTDAYHVLLYGSSAQREGVISGAGESASGGGEPQAQSPEPLHVEDPFDAAVPLPQEISYGNGDAEILDLEVQDAGGRRANVIMCGERCSWGYRVAFRRDAADVSFGMMLKTVEGIDIAGVNSRSAGETISLVRAGSVARVRFTLTLNIVPGYYVLNAGVEGAVDGGTAYLHRRVDAYAIRVIGGAARQHYGIAWLNPTVRCEISENPEAAAGV